MFIVGDKTWMEVPGPSHVPLSKVPNPQILILSPKSNEAVKKMRL